MSLKGKSVFLSGPMSPSSGVENWNVDAFALAHHKVKEAGAKEVYDPAIEYLTKGSANESHQECMRRTLHELTKQFRMTSADGSTTYTDTLHYDAIVMLPGWEGSVGARTELDVAIACGIEVVMLQDVEPYDDKSISANDLLSYRIPENWLSVTALHDCISAEDASHDHNIAKE